MKRTRILSSAGLMFGFVVALLSGSAGAATVPQPAAQPAFKQLEGTEQPVKMTSPGTPPLAGKVVETMNSGGYSYIYLEKDGKKGWVAVPLSEVKVGQEIEVKPGMEMGLFSSRTLNRSFDNIIFSPGVVAEAKSQAVQDQPVAEDALSLPAGSLAGKVVETMDAGGYTYVNLDKDGTQTWAAVPTMKVTVGEEVELQSGAVMTNFTSKSMNKTFDRVVFSGGPLHSK